jgi:hypothetical protein
MLRFLMKPVSGSLWSLIVFACWEDLSLQIVVERRSLLLGFECNEYPTIESVRKSMNLLPMPEAADGIAAES